MENEQCFHYFYVIVLKWCISVNLRYAKYFKEINDNAFLASNILILLYDFDV